MFEAQYQAAKGALSQITQPTSDAIDTLEAAAEAAVASLTTQINNLQAALATARATDVSDEQKIAALTQQIQALTAQIAGLQGAVVFDALEYGPWAMNAGAGIGGAGQGTPAFKAPGIECAELSIAPVAGTYYDNMFSQHIAPIGKKNYHYEESFLFPTANDGAASQALETDFKHQVGKLRFQFASQLDFADKQVRFWTPTTEWASFPIPWLLSRFAPLSWHKLILEAHRDDTNMYLDAITLDSLRTPIGASWAAPQATWPEGVVWGIQLDGNGSGAPYRVKIDDVKITLS